MKEKVTYKWQNNQIKDLKGEKWKNIPALEEYFMISNYGRVKRLEYELKFIDGRVYIKETMIMKPIIAQSPNHFKNDQVYFLRVTLTLAKTVYNYSVSRLVYHQFIAPFDLDNNRLLVVCKDGDGRNINLSNLALMNQSEKQLKMIEAGRHENVLLRPEIRKLGYIAYCKKYGKQISRYDTTGKRLAVYSTIAEAEIKTGINKSTISNVVRGAKLTAGGYFWRYGNEERTDIDSFLEKRKQACKPGLRKIISQYSMDGKRIGIYPSIMAAQLATGIDATGIAGVFNGKRKSAGGYFWKTGKGAATINMEGYSFGVDSRAQKRRKNVNQYSAEGKYMATFRSMKEAAASLNMSPTGLTAVCKGYQKTYGGFIWAYKD